MSGFWPLTKELFKREPVKKHTLRTFKFVMVSHKSKSDKAEWGFQWWNINRDQWMTTEKIIIKFKPCVSLCTTTSIINNLWMVLFIWAEILGTPDRTELACLHLDVLLFSRLSQPFASSSTFLHPRWNSLQMEHATKKQFFKVTYSTWCMLSLHRQCCPKRTNNFKYYNSLWHSKKPQYINKNAFYLCTKIWRCVGEKSKKALWGTD